MEKLNVLIDFYEMVGDDPELLVMLLELRRHRLENWKQRAEAAEAKLAELEKQEAIFQVEVSGNHWLNAGPVDDSDFTGLPDGVNLLYARPAPAADLVPEGWKMVPVEPTEEMIAAGDQFMDGLSSLGDAYDAMLAAAPEVE